VKRVPPTWYEQARELRAKGLTLRELSERFGVTHQRIHQVVKGVWFRTPKTNRPNITSSGNPLKGFRTTEPGYLDAQALAWKICLAAIERGELVRQPCEKCGSTKRIHAHHEDYAKPLEVVWLCPGHHVRRHYEMARERWSQMQESERAAWQSEYVRWPRDEAWWAKQTKSA
jgi:transcriptional regulator with XRE-family HTH domain